MLKKIIETPYSFLSVQPFENDTILPKCITEVIGKLLHHPKIIIYGKIAHQRRDIGFFSNESIGYHYSGQLAKSQPLTPTLHDLLKLVNTIYNAEFNGILVNRYENGNDYIGAHSDDENNLDNVGVVAISYGAMRTLRIRDKITKKIVQDVPMTSCQLLNMGGKFQKEFTHEIPIDKKIKETRYSFTFRKHLI